MTAPVSLQQRHVSAASAAKLRSSGISPLLAQLYAARGATRASDVSAGYDQLLPARSMKNLQEMASYLADCQVRGTRVLIVSDYDCDGATACAVLCMAFAASGMNFDYLVPDRMVHGYGLTPSIVEEAAALEIKPEVIITVDNGISSTQGVQRAAQLGIEVLVTDHHLAPDVLPPAKLIVNPNQPGCAFESKNIAGCGVAWYVARAYTEELISRDLDPGYDPAELLSYVALGTVADVVKLDKNNRILVREGLKLIRDARCAPGVLALARVSGKQYGRLSCADIGFGIGPRINAAGRLAHMRAGIECLTTLDNDRANELAVQLHKTNEERKELQSAMVDEAMSQATRISNLAEGDNYSIVVYEPTWHEGVVGVVAGRLKEDRHRPTIVMCDSSDGDIKGSGRSIPGFHLKHALDKINVRYPGMLKKFGGHAMAAGLTIARDRFIEFKDALEVVCREEIAEELLTKTLRHDGALSASDFTLDTVMAISQEVWGQGFEEPVFLNRFAVQSVETMGETKAHVRMRTQLDGVDATAVGFGMAGTASTAEGEVLIAHKPQVNYFRGEHRLQVLIEHLPELHAPQLSAQQASAQLQAAVEQLPTGAMQKASNDCAVPAGGAAAAPAPTRRRFGARG